MATFTGHLVAAEAAWRIPVYAQSMLWVQHADHAVQAAGERGVFSLEMLGNRTEPLVLAWGTASGPPLVMWSGPDPEPPFAAGWLGTVAVGGFIERLHVLEAYGLDLVVAEIEGGLLPPDYRQLPTLAQVQRAPFSRHAETGRSPVGESTYTCIAQADSVVAEYLYHALVSELAVDCFATLGPQAGHWHEIVGLPLLLDSVTLLAPGLHGM